MIRIAVKQDELPVRQCAELAYQRYVADIGQKPAPMISDFVKHIERGELHVATGNSRSDGRSGGRSSGRLVDGLIDGFIVFYPRAGHMFLENVAVMPTMQGTGLGRLLIKYCEQQARHLGLHSIELYTNEKMSGNLSLYPYLGYKETARREEDGFNRVYFTKSTLPG